MLRKLLKHEFRATGRIMLPMFGILLLASVGANLSIRGMLDSNSQLFKHPGCDSGNAVHSGHHRCGDYRLCADGQPVL